MAFGDRPMMLLLDEIDVAENHRPYDAEAVSRLVKSIKDIGLHYPISVVANAGRFRLVAGRHRLEAFRVIREESIPAHVLKMDDRDARMWEIAENLHRAELTTEQRMEQVAEYARLAKEKREAERQSVHSGQIESKREDGRGHRSEGGNSAAARDLGLSRQQVQRAQEYAALPADVKEKAIADGVSVTALLRKPVLLSEPAPDHQSASPTAKPLRDLVGISGGELARWIKLTTPNDRRHVIRILEMAAGILTDELERGVAA